MRPLGKMMKAKVLLLKMLLSGFFAIASGLTEIEPLKFNRTKPS